MAKKKILIVSFEFPPVVGGAGIYANDLAVGLSKNGHEVKVITFKRAKDEQIIQNLYQNYNIKALQFKRNLIFPLRFLLYFLFNIRTKKLDHLIISDLLAKKLFAYLGVLNKKLLHQAIVIFHGNEKHTLQQNPSKVYQILMLNKFFKHLVHHAQKVVVASASEKKIWNNQFKSIQAKIVHINHGVNQDYFYPITSNPQLHHELGLDKKYKYILSVSRLTQEKGQDYVIEAFRLLHEKHPNYRLIIVGDGPYKKELMQLAQKLQIQNQVIFKGAVKRQDLVQYYNVCQFFTLISRYQEAFGLVYIEAAACGKTSVSGNIGGVCNAVLHNKTGLNAHSKELQSIYLAFLKLAEDENLLNELSNNAHQNYLRNFTETKLAHQTLGNNE